MDKTIKYALIDSLGTATYVAVIASLIFFLGQGFLGGKDTVLAPISMLMLFVFSAALTGSLVFGRPILWYLDGKKREALALLFSTLSLLSAVTVLAFLLLVLIQGIY